MLRLFLAGFALSLFLAAPPAKAVDANTCGYSQGPGGWYSRTDRSGPYSLDGNCNATLLGGGGGGGPYTLASNVGAAGDYGFVNGVNVGSISGIVNGSYTYRCRAATWNSATADLQFLDLDGVTWVSLTGTPVSANATSGVVLGSNATIREHITGTPTGLSCNLS